MGLFDTFFGKKKMNNAEASVLPVLPSEIFEKATIELRDRLAPSAIEISPRSIHLGDKIARSYFIVSYPSYLTDNWFSQIVNLDRIFDVSIYIHPVDTKELLKTFEKKVAEVQSQISVRESKGMVRDPALDAAYRNLEQLRDSLIQAQQKVFQLGVYFQGRKPNSRNP
jgi:hypothetical protein